LIDKKQKIYIFYFNRLRYRGYILFEDDTHWKVLDLETNKEIDLPKSSTSREIENG
jgi:hypothetical protein